MSGGFGKQSSSGQSSSKSTSTQALDPTNEAAQLSNTANANSALASYTPYSGQLVAPTNATEQQGFTGLLNVAANNPGGSTLNSAVTSTTGAEGYKPTTVTPQTLASTDLTPYMNPYTQNVINTTNADLDRQNQIANVANNGQATAAGAFGGDRSAVLNSLTNEGYARTEAQTDAGLEQSNFTNAQSAAQGDITNNMTAQTANQNAGLAGANLNLAAGAQAGTLSQEQLAQQTALQQLVEGVGQAQQQQQQNVDTAGATANQQMIANQQAYMNLINQAYAQLGNPTFTQSSSSSTGTNSSSGINLSVGNSK